MRSAGVRHFDCERTLLSAVHLSPERESFRGRAQGSDQGPTQPHLPGLGWCSFQRLKNPLVSVSETNLLSLEVFFSPEARYHFSLAAFVIFPLPLVLEAEL